MVATKKGPPNICHNQPLFARRSQATAHKTFQQYCCFSLEGEEREGGGGVLNKENDRGVRKASTA